jgi:hypothetical protein
MTEKIIESINATATDICNGIDLPDREGIYAFFVKDCHDLGKFGIPGQLIYVGISKDSLLVRDVNTHLASGQTGWSTFRRSLGAVLKQRLNLIAQKRDKNPRKLRADKYKFDDAGEQRLTAWMIKNLKIGFWLAENHMTKEELRIEEEKVIIKLKPTLDLDKRTRHLNPLWKELDKLRGICRNELKSNL